MTTRPVRSRRDRWSDWAVIGVLVLALVLGWGVKTYAEGQRSTFTHAESGLTVRYPQDWLLRSEEGIAFSALDPASGFFKTAYQVRLAPIDASAPVTPTLSLLLNNLSFERAQQGSAYRLFNLVQGDDIDGRPVMVANYAYVVESADLFTQQMPVVVEGTDVAIALGGRAAVYSLLTEADSFQEALPAFREFVESAEIQ